MMRYGNFSELIKDKYDNVIFEALSDFVSKNPHLIESECDEIETPNEAELDSYDIKRISVFDSGDDGLKFEILVSSYIYIYETVQRYRYDSDADEWFNISCIASLDAELHDFTVTGIEKYTSSKIIPKGLLTDELVPVIRRDGFDREAENFLKEYYPEALAEPKRVDVSTIVERMGLKVREVHITRNGAAFGKIFFADMETEYFDANDRIFRKINVEKGTIFVDPAIYFMRNVGSRNNTVIHECVHWYKHKKFHDFMRLFDANAEFVICRTNETRRAKDKWTPLDWMEWQANGIAPRILMPASMTMRKIDELIYKNKTAFPNQTELQMLESVIFELADFYGVSNLSAKIRMLDLGYEKAVGVHTYVEDRFITNYQFQQGALQQNQTFVISPSDYCYEYMVNPKFTKLIDSGRFIYLDGHVCINDAKYIRRQSDGCLDLTDYATEHIDECCLIFDIKVSPNSKYGTMEYMRDAMFKNVAKEEERFASFNQSRHNDLIERTAEGLARIRADANWEQDVLENMPRTMQKSLQFVIAKRNTDSKELSIRTGIDDRQIRRWVDEGKKISGKNFVAMCIGLNLSPSISKMMSEMVDGSLGRNSEEEKAYRILLNSMYNHDIRECNAFLVSMDLDPLTSENNL